MGRAPCCEKMGLKKGPWTPEEDNILISYIQKNGHGNWRALPKQAGLARCGKSCRLRWINYLRPDIKRGNFSKEEEQTIIQLHDTLGNRWSAIAARLPGRTDNEIKNVWHTHLKKKLNNYPPLKEEITKKQRLKPAVKINFTVQQDNSHTSGSAPVSSPSHSSSELSSVTANLASPTAVVPIKEENTVTVDDANLQEENEGVVVKKEVEFEFPLFTLEEATNVYSSRLDDNMEFWYDLLIRTGDLPDLPQF